VNADPLDSYFVAAQIAHIAGQSSYDLILMGRESIDYNSGVVHGLVGEMLGIPSYSPVMKLDIDGSNATISREIDGGKEVLKHRFRWYWAVRSRSPNGKSRICAAS
jgi:electron transfer flavoprotein beta subunit